MEKIHLLAITPFEQPDVSLVLQASKAGAFPVLHIGRNKEKALLALETLSAQLQKEMGVCFAPGGLTDIALPPQVTLLIAPFGTSLPVRPGMRTLLQVHSLEEAQAAKAAGADGIILKGNESAGLVSTESAFILFQRVMGTVKDIPVYVQGGIGIHTAAALVATGATGVVLDSQLVLFPECSAPKEVKNICSKLNGNETKLVDGYRVLVRPNSPALPEKATLQQLLPYLDGMDMEKGYLPLGQDIALSASLVQGYKKLSRLIFALREAVHGHLKQAKAGNNMDAGNAMAQSLNLPYPIAQGPMTRVSDVPAFASAVAEAGALPFVALSLLSGEKARQLVRQTSELCGQRTWGVGMLGFAPAALREEHLQCILEEKPPVVLIAGGRPSQAKPLEAAGIKTFLHVPSVALLDMFIREGARRFVFEGRECGGHVGPLSSLVLWERQIDRLLQEEQASTFDLFFAGGIHDALSAAFVAVMTAPLAAKGARVGVLMGTAYLYTREAVDTGAILPLFQQQAIRHTDTVLLETAPGHETRCLYSPFADFFQAEKERLAALGTDKKESWALLEQLNVGRLRIAAKGIERRGNELAVIPEVQQYSEGMYMIGQVAALRNSVVSMAGLHEEVTAGSTRLLEQAVLLPLPRAGDKALNVAIIGMACIYPGASNMEEYWRNILLGTDSVTEVPDERWNKALYYDAASVNGDKTPSKWGGFIPRIDFDPLAFGIPPQSLAAIEPTQLLSLLVAKQALDDAGYGDATVNKENVSVIIGAEGGNDLASNYGFRSLFTQIFGEIPPELDAALPRLTEDSFPGVLANVIAGRITNRLDLGGRNYTVDAACASSLAAIDLACQELLLEKADMVLAGGADLHNGISDYLMFSSTHALSRKGRCSTFDAGADGIALGEGIAMVVLKRLEDAHRDGDRVYAVIKGVGGSSDGKSLGLTAPRRNGQLSALERAYEQAGISPAALGLVEAHGTGTVVGDKTELSALSHMLLCSGATVNQTHLGSVKTQIGHTKCAAGLAGLIKTALAVYHGVKPPTIHLKTPNAFYDPNSSPFAFHTVAGTWNNSSRIAGVSAFGFGGTNFHAVLENDPQQPAQQHTVLDAWPAELWVFSGDTYAEARIQLQAVRNLLQLNDALAIKNIAYSLAVQATKPVQLCMVVSSLEDALFKTELALSGAAAKGIYVTRPQEGKTAFLFAGQGSQRINMARDLFVAFPAMRSLLRQYPAYEQLLFPGAVFTDAALKQQQEQVKDTRVAQPLLGITDLAIAEYLHWLGIEPDMVAGHSYGELPALCFAGAFDRELLVPLSEQRAQAILGAIGNDKGMMVAVHCTAEELEQLAALEPEASPVNFNSPQQYVFAGSSAAIQRLMEQLKNRKISSRQLEVACAFHSPLLSASKALYQHALQPVEFYAPRLEVWSNTTAQPYPSSPDAIRERLTDHLVQPVQFIEQVRHMYQQGARIFIEVGPGKTLTGLTKAILGKDELLLHTEEKGQQGIELLLHTLAAYLATGRPLQLDKLFQGRKVQAYDLQQVEQYKKSHTLWIVNGQMAIPANGPLPAHGALPIQTPLQLKGAVPAPPAVTAPGAEQMVQQYLETVRHLVQAQRDVLLGYLGHTPPALSQPLPSLSAESRAVPALQQPVAAAKPAAPVSAATAGGHASVDVKGILMKVVSDKTGYPQEMLGLDLDLEADLSIDSIKRMEIIGDLKIQLGTLGSPDTAEENLMAELAAIKTLNGLLAWLQATRPAAVPQQGPAANVATGVVPVQRSEQEVVRILLSAVSEKTGYPQEMLGLDLDLEADLSIDSIKRMEIIGELKLQLGNLETATADAAAATEQLAAIKTLNGLVKWILASAVPAKAITVPSATTAVPELVFSGNDIKTFLLDAVSEKTGYPKDMLGLDLDLEADLSIDSIKRMEIIGELKIRLGGFGQEGNGEELTEQLASIKTLNGLITWLTEKISGRMEPVKEARQIIEEGFHPGATVNRYHFEQLPAPLQNLPAASLQGRRFALVPGTGVAAAALRDQLEQKGAVADLLSAADLSLAAYDGLLLLDLAGTAARTDTLAAFQLLKQLDASKAKWVFVVTDRSGDADRPSIEGYPGLLKSLGREWEQAACKTIHLAQPLAPHTIASMVLQELEQPAGEAEVFYNGTERRTQRQTAAGPYNREKLRLQLDASSVVLVLGGAQGITAELVTHLAKDYPCRYILVGRSADPRTEASTAFTHLPTKEAIRQHLIREGIGKKPAEIEQKTLEIYKNNQVLQTLRALEATGASVDYHSLDLRDGQALAALIEQLYLSYGKIDGVVHGAGILEDRLFAQKTPESFERVFSTKVTPLRVLSASLRADLQFMVLFSSVAAVFGNRGQTDYAAANSVLDQYAQVLQQQCSGRVVAVNWGPWKGTGMVSPALEKEYERRGIALIPLETGREMFVQELKYGTAAQVMILAE